MECADVERDDWGLTPAFTEVRNFILHPPGGARIGGDEAGLRTPGEGRAGSGCNEGNLFTMSRCQPSKQDGAGKLRNNSKRNRIPSCMSDLSLSAVRAKAEQHIFEFMQIDMELCFTFADLWKQNSP